MVVARCIGRGGADHPDNLPTGRHVYLEVPCLERIAALPLLGDAMKKPVSEHASRHPGASAEGSDSSTPASGGQGTAPQTVSPYAFGGGLLFFALGIGITALLQYESVGALATIKASGAGDAFAVIYLLSQTIERVVEPFTNWWPVKGLNSTERMLFLGGVTAMLGTIACFLTTGIFAIVGVTFTFWGRFPDAVLSGLLMAGGTKSLHDVISYVSKSNGSGSSANGSKAARP